MAGGEKKFGTSRLNDRADGRAELIGKIVLARFLERAPSFVREAVEVAEGVARRNGLFHGPVPALRRHTLRGAIFEETTLPDGAIGYIRVSGERPVLVYASAHFACEYTMDEEQLAACLQRAGPRRRAYILRAVRTLLLASTRNRMTHEVCGVVLRVQRAFLRTGNPAGLRPLTGRDVARRARARGAAAADASRVSRLLRSAAVVLPDGSLFPLRSLCPTSRTVLRALVLHLLERERRLRACGRLRAPWSDAEIARRLWQSHRVAVSRRLVAYCRAELGIPSARVRARRGCYVAATMDFSTLAPLRRDTILARVPSAPGLYEIRIARGAPGWQACCAGVVYLGRAKDLRRRLLAHGAPNGRNRRLAAYLRKTRVVFRFRIESGDLKRAEEDLYRQFCETYGSPPECNRMSP